MFRSRSRTKSKNESKPKPNLEDMKLQCIAIEKQNVLHLSHFSVVIFENRWVSPSFRIPKTLFHSRRCLLVGRIQCAASSDGSNTIRTCKFCKTQFDPLLNHPRACRFHTAHFGGETKRKLESVYFNQIPYSSPNGI